jgi:hypothetical protein
MGRVFIATKRDALPKRVTYFDLPLHPRLISDCEVSERRRRQPAPKLRRP